MSLDYWYDDGYGYYSDMSVGGLFDSLLGGFGSLFDGLFYDDYYYDYGYGYDDYDYGYGYDDYGYDDVLSVDGLLGGGLDLSVDGLLGGLLGGLSGLLYDDYYGYDYYGYGYDDYDYSYDDSNYDDVLSVDGLDSLSGLLDGTGLDISGLLDGGLDSLSVDGTSGLLDLLGGLLGGDLSGLLGGDSYDSSSDSDETGDENLSADASGALAGLDLSSLSSILGLLGGTGTTVSTDSADSTATTNSLLDLSSILGLLGGTGTTLSVSGTDTSSLSSILGLLGGSGSSSGLLSGLASLYGGIANIGNGDATWDDLDFLDNLTDVLPNSGTADTSSMLSTVLGLLGGSGTNSGSSLDLSSILGLLGGSGTTVSTDSTATTNSSLDLSSILGLLGGTGTTLSVSGTDTSSLSSILGLLGGSGSSSGLLSGLASLYGGIANIGNGDATWDDLDFLDNLTDVLPNSGSTDTSSMLSTVLGLLGGSGNGLDLSSILTLLGGTSTTISTDSTETVAKSSANADSSTSGSSLDLTSILGLLGNSGLNLSTDSSTSGSSLDLTSILGLLGGSDTSLSADGLDLSSLSSILSLFNGSDTSLSADDNSPLLSMLTGLLGELGITINDNGSLISSIIDTALGLAEETLTVTVDLLNMTAKEIPQASAVLSWSGDIVSDLQGFVVEIARGDAFDSAIRMFTSGAVFDVDGSSGIFSCRAALKDGAFAEEAIEWETKSAAAPRQIVSNANGQADIFFASPAAGDVWSANYYARNEVTGEIALVSGKNRIRDTFSGSESDANILYLTDDANGDALFMDDIYSEFGSDARLNLIREIRSGAGSDAIDMTSARYTAELAGMTVRGGSGNDVLWGAAGGNKLFGDDGNDRITGGAGDDLIAGGSGNDVLNGGGGSDLFTFGENWGDDLVSQVAGGSIELWFAEDESSISAFEMNGSVIFRNEVGTASVTIENAALADLTVHYGDDGSARFAELAAEGAFLGSTAEAVFETQDARSQGILASL